MQNVDLLECTLRDGSYVIDFQFTVRETAEVCAGLEQAGFRRLEVGHGLGLGASAMGHGRAAATDTEYLEAARAAAPTARIGMFFIPGIGTRSDMADAKKRGLDFIRIGTNVSETDTGEEYVKFAKDIGLEVSFNFMKSYAKSPGELVKIAEKTRQWGADVLTVVDSAGGMLPSEVAAYVKLLSKRTGSTIGFHGHNNLDLAVANNVAALEAGASVVDCSLQGIGRSAGNAQTETMVLVLEKMGMDTGIE
ncbi:MAG: 4-hydroxy-2-oxovalerate aldolase, partial [Candidatus Hydrogenedentes bacterium]|nr:4-hydroxy-2-oxovalerate aldolase [Candidatus Hydrogenedentota bacterium]